jgi:tRNA pseudouridine38-40 synthase
MKVGTGEAAPEWALEVLMAKDRRVNAATASPYGLYFVDAEYDASFGLPKGPLGPHFLAPWMNAEKSVLINSNSNPSG